MMRRHLLFALLVASSSAFTVVRPSLAHSTRLSATINAGGPWRMMPDEPRPNPEEPPAPAPQKPRTPPPLPTVEGQSGKQVDVISRLLKDRILLLGTDVNDEVANVLVAQLLYLANEDPDKDITLYINSPGGSVSAGLAIYDTMQFIPCDVQTVCFGMAASMGAFLLGAGTPGKRKSLPNARIMIHQPLGGAQGQAADIEIQAKEILFVKACLNKYMAEYTDQPVEKIAEDTDRDFFMTPQEALDYGMIDEVIKTKTSHIPMPAMPSLRDLINPHLTMASSSSSSSSLSNSPTTTTTTTTTAEIDYSQLLPTHQIDAIVKQWLHDDMPSFDVGGLVVGSTVQSARLLLKSSGVFAGKPFVNAVFDSLDCTVKWSEFAIEGNYFELKYSSSNNNNNKPLCLAIVTGPVNQLLRGERTALNTLSRCSGVATAARLASQQVGDWKGHVAGTRKTTPGFRVAEKYGLLVGGAATHRLDLSQMTMLKDNHIWSAGSITNAVVLAKRATGFSSKIEVECQSLEEAMEAAQAGANIVMLDNFEPSQLKQDAATFKQQYPHVLVEASGGITNETMSDYISEHVDIISQGKLTQGYDCLDYSLKIIP